MTEQDNTTNVEENSAESSENQERSPRGLNSREATQRAKNWENQGNLPDPDHQDGWVFRWIRTSLVGNSDNPNVSRRFREGWQPCRLEDHPELQIHMMIWHVKLSWQQFLELFRLPSLSSHICEKCGNEIPKKNDCWVCRSLE